MKDVYKQATCRATIFSLRRISRCYKSWVNDEDHDTVLKLIDFLLRRDESVRIVDAAASEAFKRIQAQAKRGGVKRKRACCDSEAVALLEQQAA